MVPHAITMLRGRDKYAEAFVASGKFACLLFDYRGFGSSDGEIRNLIDPWRHIEDWRSALAFVALPEDHGGLANSVDITRVGLWGSRLVQILFFIWRRSKKKVNL